MIVLDRRAATRLRTVRLDDRVRVSAALVLVASIASLQAPATLALALLVAVVLGCLAGLGAARLWRRLRHVETVLVMLVVLVPIGVPGTPVLTLAGLSVTAEGLERALVLLLKVNACLLMTLALIGTLEPTRLGRALAGLGVPARLVHLYLFVVRYLDLARGDVARLRDAMRARGFRAGTSPRTWRALARAAGAALVQAVERAERIEEAMRCRGFSGRLPLRRAEPIGGADRRAFIGAAVVALALVVADRWP